MNHKYIEVFGAREHNLKNINLSIPKNKLTVITGVSGSGKSSIAFDTIFAEGQRRYMEVLSAYARQYLGNMERPDVDKVEGLSPVISIEQKTTNRNPRSTVGTITEVYDFLRLLFARAGEAYSYNTGKKMVRYSEEEIIQHVMKTYKGSILHILAPLVRSRKGHYRELFVQLRKQGFTRVRIDGEMKELVDKLQVDRFKIHDIEVVIDRVQVNDNDRIRIIQSIQKALQIGKGLMMLQAQNAPNAIQFSKQLMCADTGLSYSEPSPNTFSFNSPYGYCPHCKGLGVVYEIDLEAVAPDKSKSINDGGILPLGESRDAFVFQQVKALAAKHKFSMSEPLSKLKQKDLNLILFGSEEPAALQVSVNFDEQPAVYKTDFEGVVNMVIRWFNDTSSDYIKQWAENFMRQANCEQCNGTRLQKDSLWYRIHDKNIAELNDMNLVELSKWFNGIEKKLSAKQNLIAKDILKEIRDRVQFLLNVGLDYLTLSRSTRTLSGGESQRIRLATQIGSKLQGITYILDEPSIGLHQRDNQKLIAALKDLRDSGNTVIVVEHDKDIMLAADYLIDIGPKAGRHGGEIVNQGTPKQILKTNSITAGFLSGKLKIASPNEYRKGSGELIQIKGAGGHNLKQVNLKIPLGTLTLITGVSGSGKSSLINETLYPILAKHCYKSKLPVLPYKSVSGLEHVDKVIEIDQSPIGRSPRSNPATYCGFFNEIRSLFAELPEAKIRGYKAGRFSFNVEGGRCEQCEGSGIRTIEMNFLPDVYVHCETCNGKRYNRETLEIRYKTKSIADVLDMTVDEAVEVFKHIPVLYRKVKTLQDVGLGYITLGQSAVTLSGGEAQRIKIATELSKKDTGKTVYILDEPSTGLHFYDIEMLIKVLQILVDRGNTVIVIEHNMDMIKVADHIIDIGPEGGVGGGNIVCEGNPQQIVKNKQSYTARFLAAEL